jgi:hypothetical protein
MELSGQHHELGLKEIASGNHCAGGWLGGLQNLLDRYGEEKKAAFIGNRNPAL